MAFHGLAWPAGEEENLRTLMESRGYRAKSPSLLRHGSLVYFIGNKRLSAKYGVVPDIVLKYDTQAAVIEPCFDPAEVRECFGSTWLPGTEEYFALSGDGAYLAMARLKAAVQLQAADIILGDLAKRKLRVLVANGNQNRDYRFSPDGRYLAFCSHPPEAQVKISDGGSAKSYSVCLIGVTSQTAKIVRVAPEEEVNIYPTEKSLVWSPDSRKLAFEYFTPRSGWEISLYDLTTSKLTTRVLDGRLSVRQGLAFEGIDRIRASTSRNTYFLNDRLEDLQPPTPRR